MRRNIVIIIVGLAITCVISVYLVCNKGGIYSALSLKGAGLNIEIVKLFPFAAENSLREWEDKVFEGKVVYRIEKDRDLSYVKAHSAGKASALYYKIKLDVKNKRPILRWKWKVDKFPEKKLPEDLQSTNEHDFAGRVYVVFPAMFILNSKVIEYLWAEKLPIGTAGVSPYSKNIRLMVLESGPSRERGFISEERDVLSDYLKLFGVPPEHNIGAVAFMTNSEHTKSSADAMYDEIALGYAE